MDIKQIAGLALLAVIIAIIVLVNRSNARNEGRDNSDWEDYYSHSFRSRISSVTGNKIFTGMMRRRMNGEWQYREYTDAEAFEAMSKDAI